MAAAEATTTMVVATAEVAGAVVGAVAVMVGAVTMTTTIKRAHS